MTRVALATVGDAPKVAVRRGAIELKAEDRLQLRAAPIQKISAAKVAFAAVSLAVHALLMAFAIVAARQPMVIPEQKEIAVEVVRDVPRPASQKVPEPTKAEPSKGEQVKVDQAKTEQAKVEQATLPSQAQKKTPAPQAPSEGDSVKKLQDELAQLRAEQAALETQAQTAAMGKALALPSIGTDGDAVGYQQLVFSQLAKAKGDEQYHGPAGTTGVKFEIDAAGSLVRVEIVRSSGNAALDGRALDIIHRAAPFPPPPTTEDRIVFANVNFVPAKPR